MLIQLAVLALLALPLPSAQERREVPPPSRAPESVPESVPAAPEPTYSLEVAVRTMTGSERTRRIAPGEVVELGVGSDLDRATRFTNTAVLARVTSDEFGLARATLAIPERSREDPGVLVWARIETPGRKRLVRARDPRRLKLTEPLELSAFGAGTLIGTVLDEQGQPVAGARVTLSRVEHGPRGPVYAYWKQSDALGHFAVDHSYPGTHVLQAQAPGLGSGALRALELGPGAPPDLVQVVLHGGVLLTGRVVDPDGHPVPGLALAAVPATGFPTQAQRLAGEANGGLMLGFARTDRAGQFEFPNLAPGRYTVHGGYTRRGSGRIRPELLGPALGVLSAPSAQRLDVVARAYRIEVTARDFAGAAVDLEQALPTETSPGLLRVAEVGKPGSDLSPVRLDGLLVYPVQPELEYDISWRQLDVPYFEQRVQIAPNRHRTDLPIRLGRPAVPAQLEVRVTVPRVSAERERDSWPKLELVVRGRVSGRKVASTEIVAATAEEHVGGAIWRTALPPGRYVVELGSAQDIGCVRDAHWPRERTLHRSAPIEVMPGEQGFVELRAGASGYLDFEPLRVRPRLTMPEYEALTPDGAITREATAAAGRQLGGVRVVLVSSSGQRVNVTELEVRELSVLSYSGLDWLVQGWPARGLAALPVGDWTLRLERAGELVLERPVTIVAGEITTVRW